MKLVWCPETASKAYIEAVKSLSALSDLGDTSVAELIAAMAGGWKAQLIVDASSRGDAARDAAIAIALAAAANHTRGRRVCVAPPDAVVGESPEEEVMRELEGVDFVVVDWRRRDAARLVREAKAGSRGMVVVCKNTERRLGGDVVVGKGMRVVRSAYLPIGRGVEILHVGVGKGPSLGSCSRWIKHVDRVTGEEHLFRK